MRVLPPLLSCINIAIKAFPASTMPTQRLKDRTQLLTRARLSGCTQSLLAIVKFYQRAPSSAPRQALLLVTHEIGDTKESLSLSTSSTCEIAIAKFTTSLNKLCERTCLKQLRFTRKDIDGIVPVLAWQIAEKRTQRTVCGFPSLLATCLILRYMKSPYRWCDIELVFGKLTAQLSEIFVEAI